MNSMLAVLAAPMAMVLGGVSPQPDGWLLRTDDTSLRVSAHADHAVIRSLRSVGRDYEWVSASMNVPLPESVGIAGKPVQTVWRFTGSQVAAEGHTLTLTYACASPALTLRSLWRARPGHGPVEHWMEIENHSTGPITLYSLPSLALPGLRVPHGAKVWWIQRGGGNASTEGGTHTEAVRAGMSLDLVGDPTDGASPVPWAAVQVGEESGLYVGWEFSGVGGVSARASEDGRRIALSVGNRPDFQTDVPPGGVLVVPAAFVGCYRGDIDNGAYCLHRFVLEKLRPPMPRGYPDPTLAYNLYLDAGGANAREEDVLRCARICGDLGFETFVPDAMWFPHVGDWRWDPARFPSGVAPVERLVHSAGMHFGLWCAWTNGGLSTTPAAVNVRRQADWFTGDQPPDWQPGPFYGGSICLASDGAREWATAETQRIVREFGLDYLKHDIGPIVTTCTRTTHRHSHGTDVSYWSTMGYYQVMDRLREAFPDLVLENCSGGGHIKDFGVIQRSHYTVTTDTLSNLPDRQSIWDSTFALPPLVLQAYTYNSFYAVEGDEPGPFLWRSAMMSAWQIDPTDATRWTADQRAEARREAAIYKEWIRPILPDAKVHHILPRPDGVNWDGLFYWSPSLRKGTLYVFRPRSQESERAIRLKGLQTDARYYCWSEDGSVDARVASGAELMERGLPVRLSAPYTCDLVYIQDAAGGSPPHWGAPGRFRLHEPEVLAGPFRSGAALRWSPSEGARSYRVRVTRASGEVLVERVVAQCVLHLEDLPPGETLAWSVEANGTGGRRLHSGAAGRLATPPALPMAGIVFVSDMEWVRATAGANNPVRRDSNYFGTLPAIAGRKFGKAVWTHAFPDDTPADVVVDVRGRGFGAFVATVGVDDAAGGGSVRFQVLVDGHVVAESAVLRHGESAQLRADVRGANAVTLRVGNGGDGYACDHAVWGYARFVTGGATDPVL